MLPETQAARKVALQLRKDGRYEEALAKLRLVWATEHDPVARGFLMLDAAKAHVGLGNLEKAVQLAHDVQQIRPATPELREIATDFLVRHDLHYQPWHPRPDKSNFKKYRRKSVGKVIRTVNSKYVRSPSKSGPLMRTRRQWKNDVGY